MIEITSDSIIKPELIEDAILNEEFPGFKTDYLVLHALLKIYKPKRFCEIGTNCGTGTQIIKNALGPDSEVFTLDLPTELAHISLQHPVSEGKGADRVGANCKLPFTQLRGNSTTFDFSTIYPINGFFCDGEHCYNNVFIESEEMIKSGADVIIYHDSDVPEVAQAIEDAFEGNFDYTVFRVTDCRIAVAHKMHKEPINWGEQNEQK